MSNEESERITTSQDVISHLHDKIDEQQAEAMRLADECEESATHWVHEIDTRFKAAKMLRAQQARIAELEERLEIDCRHPYDGIAARDVTIKALDERIAELEAQLEAIGAGGVEPLRKPAAQAVHQIAEPAAPAGKPIEDAIDALVMAAFTEGGCSEHRMSEARIQTELRKKELCTLIAATQPAAQGMVALRKEIENITRLLPANVDCSGVWAALAAAQAKQGAQA